MGNAYLEKILLLLDWTKKKFETHFSERGEIHFHEREIWWASLGENIGSEVSGRNFRYERPVIVLKKFSRDMMLAVPCTTRQKSGSWYHAFMFDGIERRAIIAQMRTISGKRLIRQMGRVTLEDFYALQGATMRLIKTDPSTDVVGSSGSPREDNVTSQ